jgi:hypothetical protein
MAVDVDFLGKTSSLNISYWMVENSAFTRFGTTSSKLRKPVPHDGSAMGTVKREPVAHNRSAMRAVKRGLILVSLDLFDRVWEGIKSRVTPRVRIVLEMKRKSEVCTA